MTLTKGLYQVWWVALLPLAVLLFFITGRLAFLFYGHVMAAVVWTGNDIFMGIMLGPIIQKLPVAEQRPIITRLFPKVFWVAPVSSIVTGTAGWLLANTPQFGEMHGIRPAHWYVTVAMIITAVLTVQGLGLLLPTNYRIYRLLSREAPPSPDQLERIRSRITFYRTGITIQAVLQFAIIVMMAVMAVSSP